MSAPRTFAHIYGVDFSGAKLAGHNTWIAHVEVAPRRLRLRALNSLEDLSSHADRAPALAWLSQTIADSRDSLWAMDFPFALPLEVVPRDSTFDAQLTAVARWRKDAYALGLRCVERSKRCSNKLHIRRTTDTEARTPFDCYHYRIIYQTFHGMRDVLHPLRSHKRTAVLPFDYSRLGRARNAGMARATGDYLLFLDSDDTLTPDALLAIADRLKETGEPDVLVYDYARTYWWGGTERNQAARQLSARYGHLRFAKTGILDAFFARCGIWRARSMPELVGAAELYLQGWQPRGSNLAVVKVELLVVDQLISLVSLAGNDHYIPGSCFGHSFKDALPPV